MTSTTTVNAEIELSITKQDIEIIRRLLNGKSINIMEKNYVAPVLKTLFDELDSVFDQIDFVDTIKEKHSKTIVVA